MGETHGKGAARGRRSPYCIIKVDPYAIIGAGKRYTDEELPTSISGHGAGWALVAPANNTLQIIKSL
jgi:hypothetical protein